MSSTKAVRPILSRNHAEAKRRVLNLYRAWYRQLPFIVKEYAFSQSNVTVPILYAKLREEFYKHKDVTDLRIIDMLIHRGQNELIEVAHVWKSDTHLMDYFRDNVPEKPKDFLGKFLRGHEP
ncbi:NADH dehydrogenase [ubiquinone] 1 alpha subcomplex subunit 6 [Clonorchis sinensis]|uniref:NADH dehydrogenase [ubiquinone] 1 alpha subcomplex subunit 6 n=1 Tax=Clonorchis sinensis TaxID=79923 RepID=H2KVT6_CLOSI|nr:NADH dehydrogenase [ubiquinone] 1 alpha subcomplex subunit 6 [Clonorchis sinensis]